MVYCTEACRRRLPALFKWHWVKFKMIHTVQHKIWHVYTTETGSGSLLVQVSTPKGVSTPGKEKRKGVREGMREGVREGREYA